MLSICKLTKVMKEDDNQEMEGEVPNFAMEIKHENSPVGWC